MPLPGQGPFTPQAHRGLQQGHSVPPPPAAQGLAGGAQQHCWGRGRARGGRGRGLGPGRVLPPPPGRSGSRTEDRRGHRGTDVRKDGCAEGPPRADPANARRASKVGRSGHSGRQATRGTSAPPEEARPLDQTFFCQSCQTGNEPQPPSLPSLHPPTRKGGFLKLASSRECLTELLAPPSSFRSWVPSGSGAEEGQRSAHHPQ